MQRRDFMKGVAGAGLLSLVPAIGCGSRGTWWDLPVNFDGRVVVVGAGAAGLAAGMAGKCCTIVCDSGKTLSAAVLMVILMSSISNFTSCAPDLATKRIRF